MAISVTTSPPRLTMKNKLLELIIDGVDGDGATKNWFLSATPVYQTNEQTLASNFSFLYSTGSLERSILTESSRTRRRQIQRNPHIVHSNITQLCSTQATRPIPHPRIRLRQLCEMGQRSLIVHPDLIEFSQRFEVRLGGSVPILAQVHQEAHLGTVLALT